MRKKPNKIAEGRKVLLSIDQYSGKILFNSETDLPNVVHAYLSWIQPIHFGSFGGIITRIFALIGGLMPLALTITGFFIWWPRYAHRKKHREENKYIFLKKTTSQALPKISVWRYFLSQLKKGFFYALWILPISFLSGGLYGLLGGVVWQPACLSVIFCSSLATINFVVSVLVFLFNFIFLKPFKKGKTNILRYFAWSMSFFVLYLIAYFFFSNINICRF